MSQWNASSGEGEDDAGDELNASSHSLGIPGTGSSPFPFPPPPSSSSSTSSPQSHPLFGRFPPRIGSVGPPSPFSNLAPPSLTATSTETADFDRFTDLRDEPPSTSSPSSTPSTSSSSPLPDRSVAQFDFRHGSLPPGVTIHGDAELQVQPDKSTALVLSPSAYLRVALPFAANGAIKATRVNDYSLVMDVKSHSPASWGAEGLALYQTKWDVNTMSGSEGEAYVSKGGGVGTFGEYGPSTSWMKSGKWHRVVMTMGGPWNSRRFSSYINAKPACSVHKGVFNTMDGRFALQPDSLTLFASTKPSLMPGVLLRFVEVRSATMSREQVQEQVNANRVYSYWEKEEAEVKAAQYAQLSLASLYKKPPPFWIHPAFLGQMGDAFLEGTGLDSGDVAPSIAVLSLIYSQLRNQAEAVDGLIREEDWAVVDAVSEVLKEGRELSRRFTLARKNPAQLVAFMKHFRGRLEAVKEGDSCIVSAGIDAHPVMLTIERLSASTYRLTITNSHPLAGLQYHLVSATSPPKLKYRTSLVFDGIPSTRLLDDAWWVMLFKLVVMPSKLNRPDKVYDLLLPYLVDCPLDSVLAAQPPEAEFRSPQRASTAYYKSLTDTCHYMMRRRGMSQQKCKLIAFLVRLEMLRMVDNDLQFVQGLSESDRRVVQMGNSQTAYAALKIHQKGKVAGEEGLALSTAQLEAMHEKLTMIDAVVLSLPSTDVASAAVPSPLHLDLPTPPQSSAFPLCDRLQRKEDVEGLAGLPVRLPPYVPVDVLQQPHRARTFDEALAAIRHVDRECTRIAVQGHCIKHTQQLIVSVIAHTFTHIVPVPLPHSSSAYASSPWSVELRYALQLDLLILLQRIVEHFAASVFALQPTRSFDAIRVLIPAVLMSIADVVLRKTATDIPSEVSLNLAGHPLSLPPFGVSLAKFVEQSEAMLLHTAELSVARTSVLDYFHSLGVSDNRLLFQWERMLAPEQSTNEWMSQICEQLAFPQNDIALYLSGEQHLIAKNYPEFVCYRDVAFYFKLMMNSEVEAFPPVAPWTQKHAGLKWKYDEGMYLVQAFQMELQCKPKKAPFGHRYPSPAVPSLLTSPHPAETEDDILHIKTLPSFDDSLGQRDSELFLSYLTVPYMRLPLCLTFFATEDRIHALRSEKLREVLDSVLFEPGAYLAVGAATLPTMVPCSNPHLLATPYGHLVNEVYRSPETTVTSTLRLLRLAQDLDVGTVRSSTVDIILYTIRLACRVENYLSYLVQRETDPHASIMRERRLAGDTLRLCEEGLALIRRELRGGIHRMVEAWCDEAMAEIDNNPDTSKRSSDAKMDENTRLAATLHSHLLLLYRNVSARSLNENVASQLLSSYIFLTTRHTFNLALLPVDEHEVFECLAVQRRLLVTFLHSCSQGVLNRVLESAVRTSTGTGMRRAKGGERRWGYVGGPRSVSRFAVVSNRRRDERAGDEENAPVPTVDAQESMGVEIDLSLAQMTLRSSHLKALDTAIASNEDVIEVFGAASMQAATLQSAEHREWVRLVGRNCDLQWWKTPDARPDPQTFDREYQPGELEESEQWIVPIFEPVRLTYMTRPFVLQIVLPEHPLSPHAEVAVLMGIHPKKGGNWKAIYVFKHLRVVHVYNVLSHGRRFYQSLEYTSDTRFTLRAMQPSIKDRQNPWPAWERHGAGHPYAEHPDPLSVVILRAADVQDNRAGTEETFIPSRLLYGLIPSALLDTHLFWQDTKDQLRGYPIDSDATHLLMVQLEERKDQLALRTAGVVAHIRKIPQVQPEQPPPATEKARVMKEEKQKVAADAEDDDDASVEFNPVRTTKTLAEEELQLINLLYAPPDSQLASLARAISRVENLSHVLAWTKVSGLKRKRGPHDIDGDVIVDLLELPRLKLNFQSRRDEKGVMRLYSLDHVTLFISNERSALTSKLISGLPHSLLLSNANGEVMVLVPCVHPVRPTIGTAPFSTELVLNRANKDWNDAVQDVRYHLYPVHVSLSFMFTPSLSSALYLLLLRFLHRDYAEVFRLANGIGTDIELSVEEAAIFSALKDNADAHPDAHACRMKISLVTADSPMRPGWDLTHEVSRYITKLSHVSAHCRLSHSEEVQLLQECILSVADPRYDPETMHEYWIILVGNRAAYLQALLNHESTCRMAVPGKAVGGRWTHHVDLSYMAASPIDWQSLTLQFSASPVLSGVMALDVAHQFHAGMETMSGAVLKLGFLFLYGLFTGTIKMKVAANDDSHTFATLLLQLCMDAHDPGLLPSILHTLARNPGLCSALPKWTDKRQFKHEQISGFSDDGSPSPIDDLFSQLIPQLQSMSPFLKQVPSTYPRPPPSATQCDVKPVAGREWVIPSLTNFAQSERVLRPVDGAALGDAALSLTQAQVDVLVSRPLSELSLERYVTFMSRSERGLPDVSAQLPFDVSRHPQAQSEVARAMTERLQSDMKTFAGQENTGKTAKLVLLLDADIDALIANPSSLSLTTATVHVQQLLTSLQQLRDDDSAYVSNAIPWILAQSNAVTTDADAGSDGAEDEAGTVERFRFLLRRYAGQEAHLWLETIFASLLSSESVADMQKVNPYLTQQAIADIFDVAVAVILRANRVGQANRCISDARDLLHLLHQVQHPSHSTSTSALTAGLTQKGEMLARNLVTARHYIDQRDGALVYDPRFLVFEFTWNLCLRKMQVELVRDFMQHVQRGQSMVKGMLMGEGKTTVVGPLLALMLADGKRLVVQCCPPALLEFSRSIQRSTFSSIMYKRIFTLTMERSSVVDAKLFHKLSNALTTSGLVISTPTAIKSIQLKFIELLAAIEDTTRPRHPNMEVEAAELHRTLRLFQSSVLIMDEVDLLLHPLKSELNFPIGAKLELDFAPSRWKLPIHLLDAVFYAARGRMSVGFQDSNRAHSILAALAEVIQLGYAQRALQRNPHIILLNLDFYHQQLKPVLLDWLLLWLEAQHLSGLSEEQIQSYILHGSSGEEQLIAAVSALSPKMKKMLNLSRDWLTSYLPHTLAKVDRVSFGLLNAEDLKRAKAVDAFMPSSRAVLAVPFVGKDVPSRSSEFAHPDIIIGLTILAYRYEGLRESDFHDIIASLRSTLTKEIGPYQTRKSTIRYNRFVTAAGGRIRGQQTYKDDDDEQKQRTANGDSSSLEVPKRKDRRSSAGLDDERVEVVALRLLKRSNEEQMRTLYQLLRFLPDLIHWYLEQFIFPSEMRHQVVKLQASGQDLGGEMLFPIRLAFSGTPSTLLPYELGEAVFQPGSDGLIVHTLTDPSIVSVERISEGWTVTSLLDSIASNPSVHALIDTGALITGMSNLEVARYLLSHGLSDFAGVVFLDELDRKMILIRSTGHVVPLATSGVPPEARFAFYDQIHTTGMDIQHRLNACAVLTLGKDMVFRDYAQGAYRMRGIAKGQTIRLFVIPEVVDLIHRELAAAAGEKGVGGKGSVVLSKDGVRAQLVEMVAWLVVNSMRSERVQFNMLCMQNLANVWRKAGFRALMEHVDAFTIATPLTSEQAALRRALHLFNEPVLFTVEAGVKEPRLFSQTVQAAISEHDDFIVSEVDRSVVQKVKKAVAGVVDDDAATSFDREMVQEQEAEKEQQQEQEQEAEIEIEKYVDLAYSRDNEAPTPWPFAALGAANAVQGDELQLPFLYALRTFHLYKRQPLSFPSYLHLSHNFFNPQWSGARRIKNSIVVLELVPSPSHLRPAVATTPVLTARQQVALKKAIDLFHRADSSADGLVEDEVALLIRSAMDFIPTPTQVTALMSRLTRGAPLSPTDVLSLLRSNEFRPVERGRFFVGLSLAEAETVRRILHMRLEQPVLDQSPLSLALRCLPAEHAILDASHGFSPAPAYQSSTAQHAFNFFDGSFHFSDSGINTLLRALGDNTTRQRQSFFSHVIGCRRRMTRRWEETPLAKLFTIPDQYHMLKQRAQSVRVRSEIERRGLLQYDFFRSADADRNGLLTGAELWGAMEWLGIALSADDIVDLLSTFDSDGDRNLSYTEFVALLKDPNSPPEALDADADAASHSTPNGGGVGVGGEAALRLLATKIQPKGEAEIASVMEELRREEKRVEEEELKAEREEEEQIKREIRAEEEEEDRKQEGGPNPQVDLDRIRYDFTTGRRPRLMQLKGDIQYKPDTAGKRFLKPFKGAAIQLATPLAAISAASIVSGQYRPSHSSYTLTLEMKVDSFTAGTPTLVAVGAPTSRGRVLLRSDGSLGFEQTFAGAKLRKDQWAVVTISVDGGATDGILRCFVDGRPATEVRHADLRANGRFALGDSLALFEGRDGGDAVDVSLRSALLLMHAMDAGEVAALYEAMQAEGAWACVVCTSINTANATRCTVCGSARLIEVQGGGVVVDEWECGACTSRNPNSATICQVCETPRGA